MMKESVHGVGCSNSGTSGTALSRIFLRSLPLIFAIWSGGCLQVEQALTLREDGSGIVDLNYSAPLEVLENLEVPGESGGLPTFTEEDIRRDLKAYASTGVRVLTAGVEDRAGRRHVHIRLEFDDIRGLAETSFFADNRLSLYRGEDGNYVFEQRLGSPPGGSFDVDLSPPESGPNKGFPEGFRARFAVTVPGSLITSNAEEVNGRTVRWVLGAEATEAIRFAQGEPMRVVFSGSGLDLPLMQRVRIRLPAPK